jgi:hypothetical protein
MTTSALAVQPDEEATTTKHKIQLVHSTTKKRRKVITGSDELSSTLPIRQLLNNTLPTMMQELERDDLLPEFEIQLCDDKEAPQLQHGQIFYRWW